MYLRPTTAATTAAAATPASRKYPSSPGRPRKEPDDPLPPPPPDPPVQVNGTFTVIAAPLTTTAPEAEEEGRVHVLSSAHGPMEYGWLPLGMLGKTALGELSFTSVPLKVTSHQAPDGSPVSANVTG